MKGEFMNPATANAMKLSETVKWNQLGGPFHQAGLSLTAVQTKEEKLENKLRELDLRRVGPHAILG
jgi:hypothetical protein